MRTINLSKAFCQHLLKQVVDEFGGNLVYNDSDELFAADKIGYESVMMLSDYDDNTQEEVFWLSVTNIWENDGYKIMEFLDKEIRYNEYS